jgi:hypothetical protein
MSGLKFTGLHHAPAEALQKLQVHILSDAGVQQSGVSQALPDLMYANRRSAVCRKGICAV